MKANSTMENNRTTRIKVLGMDFKVFNAAPQRRYAVAYDTRTGKGYRISCGRIDLTDREDLKERMLTVLTWNEQ